MVYQRNWPIIFFFGSLFLCGCCIRILLVSYNVFGSVPSPSISHELFISSSLNVW